MTTVTALKRGLMLLAAINAGKSQIRDLHAATRLPKSTIVRLLETLIAEGYVHQDAGKGYRVTARAMTLSGGYDAANHLLEVARPVLEILRRDHIWPCDLAIFDEDAMVILDTGRDPGTLSLNRKIGSRLPVLVTSLGRAYLGFAEPGVIAATLDRLAQSREPNDAGAKDRPAVLRLLERVRRQGYAIGDREYLVTTRSVAVPILAGGKVVASLNMMGVAQAMSMDQVVREFLPVIRQAATRIGANLQPADARST
ncbi:MAG: helix-turn-helix domain-containing protein [Rhodospirillales bacterium]|nr:helix-turn-helix domain-containing protein [Rhodospirillales bacterium]